MKKYSILIFVLLTISVFINCDKTDKKNSSSIDSTMVNSNKFKQLNVNVNKYGNINSAMDLIKNYYGEVENDDNLNISVDELPQNQYLITLVETNIKDDSIAEIMVIMKASIENGEWSVLEIDRRWKCWQGRGHSEYSSEPCL